MTLPESRSHSTLSVKPVGGEQGPITSGLGPTAGTAPPPTAGPGRRRSGSLETNESLNGPRGSSSGGQGGAVEGGGGGGGGRPGLEGQVSLKSRRSTSTFSQVAGAMALGALSGGSGFGGGGSAFGGGGGGGTFGGGGAGGGGSFMSGGGGSLMAPGGGAVSGMTGVSVGTVRREASSPLRGGLGAVDGAPPRTSGPGGLRVNLARAARWVCEPGSGVLRVNLARLARLVLAACRVWVRDPGTCGEVSVGSTHGHTFSKCDTLSRLPACLWSSLHTHSPS